MGNRPKGYWILLVAAIAAVVIALVLRSSQDDHTRHLAQYIGYGAIVLLLVARFFFRGTTPPTPPLPRD